MAMTLRLPPELDAALRETAEREGRSLHETVIIALSEYTTRRERMVSSMIASIMEDDAEALDRLGSV